MASARGVLLIGCCDDSLLGLMQSMETEGAFGASHDPAELVLS